MSSIKTVPEIRFKKYRTPNSKNYQLRANQQ
jgi:hypothetical protein